MGFHDVHAAIYFDMNLKHFEPPAHHWRMGRRMRRVYRNLPHCPPLVDEPEALREPSPSPEPRELEPSPSPSPSLEPGSVIPSPSALPER